MDCQAGIYPRRKGCRCGIRLIVPQGTEGIEQMIRIVTDTAADFSLEEAASLNVEVLPMEITFGDKTYKDRYDITPDRFYEMLIESDELPKTSQINSYLFSEKFKEITEAGDEAVVIMVSSKLSGSCQNAQVCARDFEGIYVVDSENGSIGEQLLVRYALMLRKKGRSAQEMVRRLEVRRKQICLLAMVDTLKYLRKGGRLGPAASALGTMLSLKPVFTAEDGKLKVIGKARGSRNGKNMINQEVAKTGVEWRLPVAAAYSGLDRTVLDHYIEDSRDIWGAGFDSIPVSQVGCAIGTHAGPGTIIVAYFKKQC